MDVCNRGTPHERTEECETHHCDWEGCTKDPYCSDARMRMHRKSHETRRCPTCLRDISRNSITQHINAGKCSPPETSDLIPVAAWEAKLTKWLAHAKEVPEGTLCIFDHLDVDPVFSSPARAASIISSATDMLLVIPAAAFPQLSEAERYRKRKKPDVEQPDQRPEPARPRPAAPRIGGTAAWGNVVAA